MNGEHVAVYAGSFDPPTNGHLWMVRTGARLFDRLIVAIGENPAKKPSFTVDSRVGMFRALTQDLGNVEVDSFPFMFLVDYARQKGVQSMLRGVRGPKDFEYEMDMQDANAERAPGIQTVYLVPPGDLRRVSSSFVKGLIGPQGWESWVEQYVPLPVLEAIKRKAGEQNHGRCV
jgi:pantetheine-phosphate adenylyltransferase